MDIDINEAFKSPFKTPKELIVPVIISIIQILCYTVPIVLIIMNIKGIQNLEHPALYALLAYLLIICAGMLIALYPMGYAFEYIPNLFIGNKTMPAWENNFSKYFSTGIKYSILNFIYMFVVPSLPYLLVFIIIIPWIALNPQSAVFTTAIMFQLCAILSTVLQIAGTLMFMASSALFIENLSFEYAVSPKNIFVFIKNNMLETCILFLISLIMMLLLSIAASLLFCTCLGILFIPFASFLIQIITLHLFMQIYKSIKTKSC